MTEEVFKILRSAVNIARNGQVRTVKRLRERLLEVYPGADAQVQEALSFWGSYVRKGAAA